mgnify:CR=1 FL=1
MRLFGRAWRIQVGTLVLSRRSADGQEGLDCSFKITRSLASSHAGSCELTVYNPSREHLRELTQLPRRTTFVSVDAGYIEGHSRLFTGNLRLALPKREGSDFSVTITAGDGTFARRTARISQAFAPGTTVDRAATEIAAALGVGVGNAATAFRGSRLSGADGTWADGGSLHGLAAEELTRLCEGAGLTWSVQDGQLQVLPLGGALARDAIRLGADSGLLDAPEIVDRRTTKVRALLQPGLVPGQRVVVDSMLVQGAVLRITEATFSGDTAGASWDAELTLKRPPTTLLNRSAPGVTAQNE